MKPAEKMSDKNTIALQKRYIMPCVEAWHDIVFTRGNKSKLYDVNGKEYLTLCVSKIRFTMSDRV